MKLPTYVLHIKNVQQEILDTNKGPLLQGHQTNVYLVASICQKENVLDLSSLHKPKEDEQKNSGSHYGKKSLINKVCNVY